MSKSVGSRYIWDEVDDHNDEVSAMSSLTSAKHDDFDAFEAKYTSRSAASIKPANVDIDTIKSAAEDISRKIKVMQKELTQTKKREEELTAQLIQVKTVKERRTAKLKIGNEEKLAELETETQAKLKEARDLFDGLTVEVKKYSEQHALLSKKRDHNKEDRIENIAKLKANIQRNFQQAEKQWHKDERITLETKFKAKESDMKKQAVDILAPKLDAEVTNNKQTVIQYREKADNALQKLKHSLQAEYDRKISDLRTKISQDIDSEVSKQHKANKLELEALRRKHEQEKIAQKTRFQAEKAYLEEAHDKTTRSDIDSHQQALLLINKKDDQIIQELMNTQQREVNYLTQMNSDNLTEIKKRLADTEREYVEKWRHQHSTQQKQRLDQQEQDMLRRINIETNDILNRIREDAISSRKVRQTEIESEANALRLKIADKIDHMKQNEQKLRSSVSSYASEISQLTDGNDNLKQQINATTATINEELKPQVDALRRELHAIEDELHSLDDKYANTIDDKENALEREKQSIIAREEELLDELSNQNYELNERKNKLDFEFRVELNSIKEKISRLLNKKNAACSELQSTLEQIILNNEQLSNEIEEMRHKRHNSFE